MKVCRLCGSTEALIDVFDAHKNTTCRLLKYYIVLATGVQIEKEDQASKMVCQDCCDLVMNIYQFRVNAHSNNILLNLKLPDEALFLEQNNDIIVPVTIVSPLHKSVEDLYTTYPDIIIPNDLYECNLAPTVILNEKEISKWRSSLLILENGAATVEESVNEPHPDILIKEDLDIAKTDGGQQEQDTQMGSLIIKRLPNRDNKYEVINCIRDDQVEDVSDNTNCNNILSKCIESNFSVLKNAQKERPIRQLETVTNTIKPKKRRRVTISHKSSKPSPMDTTNCKSQFICQVCTNSYTNKKKFISHQNRHLSCKFCKSTIVSTEDLEFHESERCSNKSIKYIPSLKKVRNNSKEETIERSEQNTNHDQRNKSKPNSKPKEFLKLKPLQSLSKHKIVDEVPGSNASPLFNTLKFPLDTSETIDTRIQIPLLPRMEQLGAPSIQNKIPNFMSKQPINSFQVQQFPSNDGKYNPYIPHQPILENRYRVSTPNQRRQYFDPLPDKQYEASYRRSTATSFRNSDSNIWPRMNNVPYYPHSVNFNVYNTIHQHDNRTTFKGDAYYPFTYQNVNNYNFQNNHDKFYYSHSDYNQANPEPQNQIYPAPNFEQGIQTQQYDGALMPEMQQTWQW